MSQHVFFSEGIMGQCVIGAVWPVPLNLLTMTVKKERNVVKGTMSKSCRTLLVCDTMSAGFWEEKGKAFSSVKQLLSFQVTTQDFFFKSTFLH